jgi:hypothetical protein
LTKEGLLRTNSVAPDKVARGRHAEHTKAKRVVSFHDDETFDLLREMAVKRGVGLSAVVREVIDRGLVQMLPRA